MAEYAGALLYKALQTKYKAEKAMKPTKSSVFFIILGIAAIATFVEGATPRGLDNLSVPFVTAFLYWFTLGVV